MTTFQIVCRVDDGRWDEDAAGNESTGLTESAARESAKYLASLYPECDWGILAEDTPTGKWGISTSDVEIVHEALESGDDE